MQCRENTPGKTGNSFGGKGQKRIGLNPFPRGRYPKKKIAKPITLCDYCDSVLGKGMYNIFK